MGTLAASNVKKLKSTGDPCPLDAKAANRLTIELVSLAAPFVQERPCRKPHRRLQVHLTILRP